MEDNNRSPQQLQQAQEVQLYRWPILARHYFKVSSLVEGEGWPVLVEELLRDRQDRMEILSRPLLLEREADEQRGAIVVLNWLLRLAEDVKDFPR